MKKKQTKIKTKARKQPKKKLKIMFLDTKKIEEKEVAYEGDDTILKLLGSKTFKTEKRKFRDTILTVYFDPEKQGIDNSPVSITNYGSSDTNTFILGKSIIASTTEAGYIGSLKKEQMELLNDLARYTHWRWEEDTIYYCIMGAPHKN
jgi:hypothetical protein